MLRPVTAKVVLPDTHLVDLFSPIREIKSSRTDSACPLGPGPEQVTRSKVDTLDTYEIWGLETQPPIIWRIKFLVLPTTNQQQKKKKKNWGGGGETKEQHYDHKIYYVVSGGGPQENPRHVVSHEQITKE